MDFGSYAPYIGAVIGIVILIVCFVTMYVQAPPSVAYILSGWGKQSKILIGTGGIKIPFIQRLDKLFLGQVTVDIRNDSKGKPIQTKDYIDVDVDAVCKIQVDPEGIALASKNFLNMNPTDIARQVQDSLEGNMREVVGAMNLDELVQNRDKFSDEIEKKAQVNMKDLGLKIISCNIQTISDKQGLIQGLGADNTYKIRKDAAITKANAERDIEIAEQEAKKAANDVRVKTETEIAERNNELKIRQAELQIVSDAKKADADAAYEIQKQEQQKTINTKTVDAQIEQTKREQVLSSERIKIKQNELTAEVNANADADKYKIQINAEATLEQQKREAEAKAYLAEQEAKAIKAKADADRYLAEQEAAGIKAKGLATADATAANLKAEAEGIKAKALAEAEGMEKKAEAYERYGQVAVIDMLSKMSEKILPEVAKNVAEPMAKIGNVTVYGTNGSEVAGMSSNVPAVMKQTFDVVKDITGVDMSDIMRSQTINAKTDKNINLSGADGIVQINS